VQNSAYTSLAATNVNDFIAEELAGFDVQLAKIKIPSGGGLAYEIPDEDGEITPVKEFSGVVLYQHAAFVYYKTKYEGGSNPPDCYSYDGMCGIGDPGGNCKTCPLNDFGTGENNSKACKNRRRLYILREGELLPMVFSLPTGSLNGYRDFLRRNLSRLKKCCHYVTNFSLEKAVNVKGVPFSKAVFYKERDLLPEEISAVELYALQIKQFSRTDSFDYIEDDASVVEGAAVEPLKRKK
jgi:hypothetical protein